MRIDGDWESWLDFVLDAIATISDEAVVAARELFALVAEDRARVLALQIVYDAYLEKLRVDTELEDRSRPRPVATSTRERMHVHAETRWRLANSQRRASAPRLIRHTRPRGRSTRESLTRPTRDR